MSRSPKNSVKVINRKILDCVPSHPNFKVFMYNDELEYLKWLVLQKYQIETGGDLFGLWQSKDTAVVQLVLGPGKNCSRTTTSFHQDVKYLEDVGQHLTSLFGLCNIGEWHSHHTIGLAEPSLGDKDTVWSHMADVAGGRFLVFIANIVGIDSARIGCFMFDYSIKKMLVGDLVCLPQSSPIRQTLNSSYLKPGAEPGQDWETFLENRRTPVMNILGNLAEYDDSDPDNAVVKIKLPPQLSQPSVVDMDVESRDYGEEERLILTANHDNETRLNKHFGRRFLQSVCGFSAWSRCRECKFWPCLCTFKRYMSRLRGFFARLISNS